MSTGGYAITVFEYATRTDFPESIITYGGGSGTQAVPFAFGLLRGEGRLCLVDTGIGSSEHQSVICDQQGIANRRLAQDVLAEAGVAATDIDSVFVTHAHYDHFGNIDAFPNARFYVQRRELEEWLHVLSLPPRMQYFSDSIDPDTLASCVKLATEGRLRLVDGDLIGVLPGIDLRAAHDTHTFGSMWVSVEGKDGLRYALVGDNMYSYDSVQEVADGGHIVPIGQATGSNFQQIECIAAALDETGDDVRRIIPFHDAKLTQFYPHTRGLDGHATIEVSR